MTLQTANEALSLSREAQEYLQEAYDQLGSAGRFGIWDILGGGLISGLFKHSRIDSANESIERAKRALNELGRVLENDPIDVTGTTDLGGFARFADFFFDGLFADLYMQGRIRDAQREIANTLDSLRSLDGMLMARKRELKSE